MQDLDNSLVNLNTAIQRKNQQGDDYVRMVNALIEEITNFLNGLQQNNNNSAALQQELNAANEQIRRLTEENVRIQEQLRVVEARANEVQERERVCNEALARLRQDGQGNAAQNAEQLQRLQQDLANAQQAVQQTNAQRDELLRQLEERTGRIQENVAQIAQMHINREDSEQLNENSRQLRALIAGLVAARGPGGAGARGPGGAGAGNGIGGLPNRIARQPNAALGQGEVVNPIRPRRDQNAGKTKRRRGKKSMYRGGYVEKLRAKKTRKRARTSKRRSGRKSTASSSSSSSASSNSRQKAMQGRKM